MGLLNLFRTKPKVEAKSLSSPEDWLLEIFGSTQSTAGITVTPASAMKCAPVRRAVQAIAEPVGALPLHVFRRDGENRERDAEHPVAKVLRDPNPWTSASDFREQMQRDALLHGNAYAQIVRVEGKPRELIRLDPGAVSMDCDDYGAPTYKVTSGDVRMVPREDIFHLKAPSTDGIKGRSPVVDAAEAIGLALLLEQHGSRLFANGAKPGGVIEIPGAVGDDSIKKIRLAWQASSGGENTGKTAVLVDGAKFNPAQFNSVDSQYLELRRFAIDEIARVFGVPPSMLFEMGRATWGNAAELWNTFKTLTLSHWLKVWQSEIRLKLFTADERDSFFAEFNVDALLNVDFAARATAYGQYRAMGAMTGNEVRRGLNLPPIAGADTLDNPNITTPANSNVPAKGVA